MIAYGLSVRTSGSALVCVDHTTTPPIPVSVESLPFDLAAVADRIRELVGTGDRVYVDLDGRGQSLRLVLGRQPGVRWYRRTGRERRELTDTLDAVAAMPGFRFGPDIAHRDEMRRALESLRKSVDEDGSPEREFAVALALALIRPSPVRVHGWLGPPPESVRLVRR